MNCTITDLKFDERTQKIINKVREKLRGHNVLEKQLGGIIISDDFINYVKQNYASSLNKGNNDFNIDEMTYLDLPKFNSNDMVKALQTYYTDRYKSIAVTAVKYSEQQLNGFKSGRSKVVARDYCGTLIIDGYVDELVKPKEKRISMVQLLTNVINKIESDYYTKYLDPYVKDILDESKEYDDEIRELAKAYNDTINKLNADKESYKQFKSIVDANNARKKELIAKIATLNKLIATKKTDINAANEQIEELKKQIATINKNMQEYENIDKHWRDVIEKDALDRFCAAMTLGRKEYNITGKPNAVRISQIREYANLVAQVKENPNEWFFQVMNTKKVTNLYKLLSKTGDIGKYYDANSEEADTVQLEYDGQSIDEFAKSWEDNLYHSYTDTVNDKLKMYLSTIVKLNEAYDSNNELSIDTDNELGVKTTMDFAYVVKQIYSFGNFNSPETMIKSLEDKCSTCKPLYGLTKLVADMKADYKFANLVYCAFNKPIVNKTIITIHNLSGETNFDIDYSNPNAFPSLDLTYKLMNVARNLIRGNIEIQDGKKLATLLQHIINFKNDNLFSDLKDDLKQELFNIVNKYFPTFKQSDIANIEDIDNIRIIANEFLSVLRELTKIHTKINAKIDELNKEYSEQLTDYNNQLVLYYSGQIDTLPTKPNLAFIDYSEYDLNPTINKSLINIAQILLKYSDSKARLNSTNAEGNTSSDVIKQCFVTRFFEQLNATTEEDALAGLKSLCDYFTQGGQNQYSNNPILFGLHNIDGTPVQNADGLFKKDINGTYRPTKYAKEILKYNLFDGIKNERDGIGQMYNQTRQLDWQISTYTMYKSSLVDYTNGERSTNIGGINGMPTAVYSMRIPSDAPKIFFIKAPKYSDSVNPNKTTNVRLAIYNHVLNEVHMFINALNNIFEYNSNNELVLKTNKEGLFNRAYFDDKIADKIRKEGAKNGLKENECDYTDAMWNGDKLIGNMFKFRRLFELNDYDAAEAIETLLSLYGESDENLIRFKNGKVTLNTEAAIFKNNIAKFDEVGKIVFNRTDAFSNELYRITNNWCNAYVKQAKLECEDFIESYESIGGEFNPTEFREFLLNYVNMNITYDDLFEGDYKYYGGSRDFLKRTKEAQAGGSVYADGNILEDTSTLKEYEDKVITIKRMNGDEQPLILPSWNGQTIEDKPMCMRNGFRAVTIRNVIKPADAATELRKQLEDLFISENYSKEQAHKRATKIAAGYFSNSKMNDAQSYITFEEFIRRKIADGTYYQYEDIIKQILEIKDGDDINILLDNINARIQIQKNFYFDKPYNSKTNEYYARQIKNAEFVLIPQLLPKDSELRKIYDWMRANDIGQLNTAETSKAANKNVFSIWEYDDENGIKFNEDFANDFKPEYVETYYYKYLYKQQDVPQHLVDEKNKAGIQITKKIIDNITLFKDSDNEEKRKLYKASVEYQNAYVENIKEDFYKLIDSMGWVFTKDGRIINKHIKETDENGNRLSKDEIIDAKENLDFTEFWALAREQAANLGMDSKFIECLTPDNFGDPKVPNWLTNNISKLESIAQSIFNSHITRQTFPGWHGAQVTGIGLSRKLHWDPKTGVMEIMLPRWSKLIPKGKNAEENARILKQIEEEGLDLHIGYRIPTEGKQSIAVMKIVGFVDDCLGSTIVVPDEWVVQTGSDFDVDSIYGICWEMYKTVNKNGDIALHKIKYEEETEPEAAERQNKSFYIKYVNSHINSYINKTKVDDIIKSVKDTIYEKYADRITEEKYFKQKGIIKDLREEQQEIYKKLSNKIKHKLAEDKLQKVTLENGKSYNDWVTFLENKLKIADEIKKEFKLSEEQTNKLDDYIDITNRLLKGCNIIYGNVDSLSEFRKEKKEAVDEAIQKLKDEYFKKTEDAAKELGLMTYEQYKSLPFVQKLSRKARNNYILDRLITIMKSPYTKEEQYSRSQFEDIIDGKEFAQYISGENEDTFSPYDWLSQVKYQNDVMGGAALKAKSVNCDTFTSKMNRIRVPLTEEKGIKFILPTEKCIYTNDKGDRYIPKNGETHAAPIYDKDELKKSYGNDIQDNDHKEHNYVNLKKAVNYDHPAGMGMSYEDKKRNDVKSKTTFNAIIRGERTATTRYKENEASYNFWSNLKVGDIVRVYNGNKTRSLYIQVTKAPKDVTNIHTDKQLESWSKKEGWSVDYLKNQIKTATWKSGAVQVEFKFIGEHKDNIDIKDGYVKVPTPTYEVSTAGDKRFSALNATFSEGTKLSDVIKIKNSEDVDISGKTIEFVYQALIKHSNKGEVPAKDSILYNKNEEYSYRYAYLPLWQLWAKQNPALIEELKELSKGKRLNDKYAKTIVNQARALTKILNKKEPEYKQIKQIDISKAEKFIEKEIGVEEAVQTVWTLRQENAGLTDDEIVKLKLKRDSRKGKPIVMVASEHTDPVFHAAHIKKIVEDELAKPAKDRLFNSLYFITKHDGLPLKELLELKMPKVVHFSITGLGNTKWEPGVMKADDLLDRIEEYIKSGILKAHQTTIRIDPVIPGITTPAMIRHIVERGLSMGIQNFKFSVMDSYGYTENTPKSRKIVEKMKSLGYSWDANYNRSNNNGNYEFNAKPEKIASIYSFFERLGEEYNIYFNTCGEAPAIRPYPHIRTAGCLSAKAVNAMLGTNVEEEKSVQRGNCSCYGGKFDMLRYDDKCCSSCTYCYAGHNNDKSIQYYDEHGNLKDNAFTRATNNLFTTKQIVGNGRKVKVRNPERFILHSGGSIGADSMWGDVAEKYGIPKIVGRQNHYYYKDRSRLPSANVAISDDEYEEGRTEIVKGAIHAYGFSGKRFNDERIARNWFQVKNADAIYAIGYGINAGEKWNPNNPNDDRIAQHNTVRGDTAYAVSTAIVLGKPVYVFDLNKQLWHSCIKGKWNTLTEAPTLTENFAAIGSRECESPANREIVLKAMEDCFINTFCKEIDTETVKDETIKQEQEFAIQQSNKEAENRYKFTDGIKFNARRIGYSNTDKNVVGDYVTTSTAQTTAHHLDAVKEGSLKTVNDYTFNAYKLMSMLGMDHWGIITVMYNPVITKLVNSYNSTNSIYSKNDITPIQLTLAKIAKSLNLHTKKTKNETNGNSIDLFSSMWDIFDAIKGDKEIVEHFYNMFDIDLTEYDNIYQLYNEDIPINIEWCIERIKVAKTVQTTTPQNKRDAVFDIGLLLAFNKLMTLGSKITEYAMNTNSDKFGAKNTIKETNDTIDAIEKLRFDDTFEENIINKIYPTENDVESEYPSLNACYRYATQSSVYINTRLFKTESQEWRESYDLLETRLGHKFNIEEYQTIRAFALHYLLYSRNSKLIMPLRLTDKRHEIRISENQSSSDLYNDEITRIFGYGYNSESILTIDDVNNPTSKEIEQFATLSPAQKVLFIQKNFKDDKGIFDYIRVSLFNSYESKRKNGVTRNYLSFDEDLDNIEDLFALFTNAYQNHNPIIRLAAIDLIKYAFIAEGYNFKYGYITKIVTNNSLYDSVKQGGLDLIDDLNKDIQYLPNLIGSDKFARIIAQHFPNFITTYKLPNLPKIVQNIDEWSGELMYDFEYQNMSTKFNNAMFRNKMLVLSTTNKENDKLIKKLRLNKYKSFINVEFPIKIDDYTEDVLTSYHIETKHVLYKVIAEPELEANKPKMYILIPLNKLDVGEITDYSYNPNNNEFDTYENYIKIADEYSRKSEETINIDETDDYSVAQFDAQINNMHTNPYYISEMIHSVNEKNKIAGKKFVDAINNLKKNNEDQSTFEPNLIMIPNFEFSNAIEQKVATIQRLDIQDGVESSMTVRITKLDKSNIERLIKSNPKLQYVADRSKYSLNDYLAKGYYVEDVTSHESDTEMAAETELLDEDIITDISNATNLRPQNTELVDIVSKQMISEIDFVNLKNATKASNQFMHSLQQHKINIRDRKSIEQNRYTIYRMANAYYKSTANKLLSALNNFSVIDNGEVKTFALGDPALYEYLGQHNQYVNQIIQIILDGITFGNRFSEIFELANYSEDEDLGRIINEIIKSINLVKNNNQLNNAMKNIMDVYFRKYSTNPMIIDGLLQLRDTFGDTDKMWSLVSATTEINNTEVQTILKQVYGMLSKAQLFDAEKNVKEWDRQVDEIKTKYATIDESKIFDKEHGKLYQMFNDKFLEDYDKINDEYNEAYNNRMDSEAAFGKYIDAKFKRDTFMYEHTEQKILPDYYRKKLEIEKRIMYFAKDAYIKYKYLSAQKWEIDIVNDDSEENKIKLRQLQDKMFYMTSNIDVMGNPKEGLDEATARVLDEYKQSMAELNEEYFDSQEYDGFQEEYERYYNYIKAFDNKAENKFKSLEEKLEDDMYKIAYNWIKYNGYVTFTGEEAKNLKRAFKALTGETTSVSSGIRARAREMGIVDDCGIIDARKYSEEDILRLKEIEENTLSTLYDNGYGEAMLIKDIANQEAILAEYGGTKDMTEFITKMFNNPERKTQIIKDINTILKHYIDINSGQIDYKLMVTTANNEEELKRLSELYKELYNLRSEAYKRYNQKSPEEDDEDYIFTDEIDTGRFINAVSIIDTNSKNKSSVKYTYLKNILNITDENGSLIRNPYLFGYKKIKEDYVDKEKTAARKYIKDNVDYTVTEYYREAYKDALNKGKDYFVKWYANNHVYNPYSHQYEPLKVWTTLSAKANSQLAKSIKYMPTFDNRESFVKKEYVNNEENRKRLGLAGKGFQQFSKNYKHGDSKYDNPVKLNEGEEALRNLIEITLNKYATTYQGRKFVGEGFLPRERVSEINWRWAANQSLAMLGLSGRSGKDADEFYQDVDYVHDREADMQMLQLLKTKGTKKMPPAPIKGTMSDDDYKKAYSEWKKECKKITAENLKLDNAVLNKNFMAVMRNFVYNATIFNSTQEVKPLLYLLIEDLANNNAYTIKGLWDKRLVKDAASSTPDDIQYQKMKQTNTTAMVKNLTRRILFNQYHNNTPLRTVANFLQNMASAKFMIFNLYGGIANVTTGKVNIAMEEYANKYFGFNHFNSAQRRYLQHSASYIADQYKDTASCFEGALIKKFNIVEFDEILQFGDGTADLDTMAKRVRNAMYSFQSMGEHYMQNSVLLAMLNSNRIYTDDKGIKRIGDFKDYSWEIEKRAMKAVVEKYPVIKRYYEIFLNNIKYDKQSLMEINMGTKSFNVKFLRTLYKSNKDAINSMYKTIGEEYAKTRKQMIEEAKKEFSKFDTVENLFEFVDGKVQIKQDKIDSFGTNNPIGDLEKLIAEFRDKVIAVNHHIHGVYDKKGSALLESTWFGSLVMQYKKHLPMGILKRLRRKGYYSEFRGSMERGTYMSLIDFLGMEFNDFKDRVNKKAEDTNVCLASLQVAMESIINILHNYRFNYNIMDTWMQDNMRRNLAEFTTVLICMAIVMALYAGWDDDEVKDNKWRASLLYLTDRLYSETTMYTPLGMISEFKTTYNSPVASASGPSDALKLMQFTTQYLFDPEFNVNYKTGQYAGRNKFGVILKRNLPGMRPIDRIEFITRYANYYKLDKSQTGIHIAKNFGEYIHNN